MGRVDDEADELLRGHPPRLERLVEADRELDSAFHIEDGGALLKIVRCRNCARAWDLDVGEDGTIDRGSRNALLAHAKAHTGGGARLRRRQ